MRTSEPKAWVKNTDTTVASLLVLLYFVLVIALVPRDDQFRAILSGLAVFGAIAIVGRILGRGPLPGMSLLGTAFVGIAVLAFPTFPAISGKDLTAATPVGFFGAQAGAILWAALRWRELPRKHQYVSLREAWRYGGLMAIGISAVAAVPVLLMFLSADPRAVKILLVFPAYFAGFLAAASIYWALQRIDHLAVGRYALGALGGFCVYFAIGPVASQFEDKPTPLSEMILIGVVAGTLVGPAFALGMDDDEKRMRNRKHFN